MISVKINWDSVQSWLNACRSMDEAGNTQKAQQMLIEYAKHILESTKKCQ